MQKICTQRIRSVFFEVFNHVVRNQCTGFWLVSYILVECVHIVQLKFFRFLIFDPLETKNKQNEGFRPFSKNQRVTWYKYNYEEYSRPCQLALLYHVTVAQVVLQLPVVLSNILNTIHDPKKVIRKMGNLNSELLKSFNFF